MNEITKELKEETKEGRIEEDHFTTYQVNEKGFIENVKGKTMEDVFIYLISQIKEIDPGLFDCLEYFHKAPEIEFSKRGEKYWPLDYRWIAVYWVRGDSEGYYVHVDAIFQTAKKSDKRELLFLGKVWTKDEAKHLVNILCDVLHV